MIVVRCAAAAAPTLVLCGCVVASAVWGRRAHALQQLLCFQQVLVDRSEPSLRLSTLRLSTLRLSSTVCIVQAPGRLQGTKQASHSTAQHAQRGVMDRGAGGEGWRSGVHRVRSHWGGGLCHAHPLHAQWRVLRQEVGVDMHPILRG